MDFFENEIVSTTVKFFSTGDGMWLLEAIRQCAQYGKPIPPILRQPYDEALRRYRSGEARSLDEAFSVSRKKGWNQSKQRLIYRKGWEIYQDVLKAHDDGAGASIDLELFERIGTMHGISGPTARNYYREVKQVLQQIKDEMQGSQTT